MNKYLKRVLATAIAGTMALGLSMPAFATNTNTNTDPDAALTTNVSDDSEVQITKNFKIPAGVEVPTAEFAFSFTPCADAYANEGEYVANAADYPDLSVTPVSYSSATRATTASDSELKFGSGILDLSTVNTWPHAGLYVYTVTETNPNVANVNVGGETYFLKVYIKNGDNGVPVFDKVAVVKGDNSAKVDASPLNDNDKDDGTDGVTDYTNGNGFLFVNTYAATVDRHPINPDNKPTPGSIYDPDSPNYDPSKVDPNKPNPDLPITDDPTTPEDDSDPNNAEGAFKLNNKTDGTYADKTKEFTYTVTITPSPTSGIENGASVPGGKINGTDETFVYGTPKTITLSNGEALTFDTLPVGTVVTVAETGSTDYTPSYKGFWSDTNQNGATGASGESMTVDNIVVGSQGAYVQFTQNMSETDVTPTGIVINNLPYILMIVISVAGIGAYVVSRKRA